MSLAVRILAVVLLLNLLVVGAVQTAAFASQQGWIREQHGQGLAAALAPYLLDVYSAERLADETQAREHGQADLGLLDRVGGAGARHEGRDLGFSRLGRFVTASGRLRV